MISTYMISLDVLLRKFVADTVILFCPHATHLPVLISSHIEYCVSGMYCHMTLILVRLQLSNVLLAQTFCKNF